MNISEAVGLTRSAVPVSLVKGPAIAAIQTMIVDVPTTRRHRLPNTEIDFQSSATVKVVLSDGPEGWGAVATLGGPR